MSALVCKVILCDISVWIAPETGLPGTWVPHIADTCCIVPGPYASAILRFQIKFPPSYPDLPPLVTFSTDVFHPLIVPLTTYTFSTNASNEDPVSATDEERLPPGGFSLRHGFPHWFGRAKRSDVISDGSLRDVSGNSSSAAAETATTAGMEDPKAEEPSSPASPSAGDGEATPSDTTISPPVDKATESGKSVPVLLLLDYIRSTFDGESVLDSLPLEAAGNPSAWHAWKAHRRDHGENQALYSSKKGSPQTRLPGDWHWDGIWAKRVQEEVEASHSEATLFGNPTRAGGDDLVCLRLKIPFDNYAPRPILTQAPQIRFSRLDDATLTNIKEMIIPPMEEAHE